MKRILGVLAAGAAVVGLAACGSESSAPQASDFPQGPSAGPIHGAEVLPLISLTGGGGRPTTRASLLGTPAQVDSFTRQLREPLAHQVEAAVRQARGSGYLVYGAVVAVGCDRPPSAGVALDEQGDVEITPAEVASPLPECLAPVTTVAIATVPGAQ